MVETNRSSGSVANELTVGANRSAVTQSAVAGNRMTASIPFTQERARGFRAAVEAQ